MFFDLNSTRRVDEDAASSMPERVEVEHTGREQDTDNAPCTNLRARWTIRATRQGLPCTAWLATFELNKPLLRDVGCGSYLPIRLGVGGALLQ